MLKVSYIRQLPNKKWRVFSEKGKNLGTFDTKNEAKTRLKQIEMFKHMKNKASFIYDLSCEYDKLIKLAKTEDSYSSMMRKLRKEKNKEQINIFQKSFKKMFDEAVINEEENPEKIALTYALKKIDSNDIRDDVVTQERDVFDNGAVPPAFNPQQSFAPFLDVEHQHTSYASIDEGESAARRKIFMKIMELLNQLNAPNNKDDIETVPNIPLSGVYDNYTGIAGAGPTGPSGFVQY